MARPARPTVTASTTAPTNQKVFLYAEWPAVAVEDACEYSFDKVTWITYTSPVEVEKNCRVYFRCADELGNYSYNREYRVTNIDKVAPSAPIVTASTTKITNQDVTVSANKGYGVARLEFCTDGQTWNEYAEPIVFSENGSVQFRAIDAAGNISEKTTYDVTNIDKEAPEKPVVTASVTTPTEGAVRLTATWPEDAYKKQYSLDDGETWNSYSSYLLLKQNAVVQFRAIDLAGNSSEIVVYDVDNIYGRTPLEINIEYSTTERTNQPITVTVTANKPLVKVEYTLTNGKTWLEATKTGDVFTIERNYNGSFQVRGTDVFNNVDTEMAAIWNVDRTGPARPTITASTTAPTNQNVILAATWSADSIESTREYSFDRQTWIPYTDPVEVESNCSVYFRSQDDLHNVGYDREYKVTNIDKVAPNAPTAKASTTKATNQNVTVTAKKAYGVTLLEYNTDGQTWNVYSDPVVFEQNGSVQFRATDAAGNVSNITTYDVTNIDKEAPDAPVVVSNPATPTTRAVRLTATWSDDAYKKQYSLDGGNTWNSFSSYLLLKKNALVQFRAIDKAGNVSDVTEKNVDNIFQLVNGTSGDDVMAPSTDLADFRNGRQDWLQGRSGDDVYLFGADDWGSAYVSDTADSLLVFDEQRQNAFTLSNDPLTGNTVARFDGVGEDYSVIYFDRIVSQDEILFADVSSLAGKTAEEIRNAFLS